jgi:VIT1/CCC1 family predicted Fe2+/Mn2+ transporter
MSSGEKQNIISLVTSVLISVPYYIYILNRYQSETLSINQEFSFWATAIVLLVPLRIVSEIMVYIVISIFTTIITKQEEKSLTDERDKLIELKGTRNSAYTFMIGVFLAMLAMAQYQSPFALFTVFILSGFASELVGNLSKIYYYRKGV